MKKLLINYFYLLIISGFVFTACEEEGISRIEFDKSKISLMVGKSDTITSTITYVGDISNMSVTWNVEDPSIVSIKDISESGKGTSNKTITKTIVIKALKSGVSKLTIQIGDKSHVCDITVSQNKFEFLRGSAFNYGDYYDIETNNFELILVDGSLAQNSQGQFTGNGNMLILELNLPLSNNTLSPGEFSLSTEGETYTFFPGDDLEEEGEYSVWGTHVRQYTDDGIYATLIKDGGFVITKNASDFTVSGELVLDDDEIISFSYTGRVTESDQRDRAEVKVDTSIGLLVYYGDAYSSGKSNNFNLALGNGTIKGDSIKFEDKLVLVELNTALEVKDYVPAGRYNMMKELTKDELKPFSIVFGYVDDNNNEWGTWLLGSSEKKIKTGYMEVVKSDDNYMIEYEFYDRFGARVYGTFEGKLKYEDATKGASQISAAKVKSNINGIRTIKQLTPTLNHHNNSGKKLNYRMFKLSR
ncbi:hypothetical protein MASR2M117_20050 [Paludibacter sp.]